MLPIIGWCLLGVGLGLDVLSLYRGIRRINGDGPSGVPVLSCVLYLIALPLLLGKAIWYHYVLLYGCAVVLHAFFQYFGVWVVAKFIYKP